MRAIIRVESRRLNTMLSNRPSEKGKNKNSSKP